MRDLGTAPDGHPHLEEQVVRSWYLRAHVGPASVSQEFRWPRVCCRWCSHRLVGDLLHRLSMKKVFKSNKVHLNYFSKSNIIKRICSIKQRSATLKGKSHKVKLKNLQMMPASGFGSGDVQSLNDQPWTTEMVFAWKTLFLFCRVCLLWFSSLWICSVQELGEHHRYSKN